MGKPNGDTDGATDGVDQETMFEVLESRSRRLALFHLRQHGRATINELSEVVASLSTADDGEPSEEAVEEAYSRLFHRDLPMLEHHGLVTMRQTNETVTAEPLPAMAAEWLDLATRQELRRERIAEETDEVPGDDPRVLVVDDDPHYLELTETYLERDGLEVTTVQNALDAFSHLEGGEYDCIISDYKMPSIDGLELLAEVRRSYPELPFLLLTNKGNEGVASDAIRSGVSDYVVKGTDPQLLKELGDRVRGLAEPTNDAASA